MEKPGGEPLVRAIGFRGLTLSTLNLVANASIGTIFAASAAGLYAPLAQGLPRALLLVAVYTFFAVINVRGVKGFPSRARAPDGQPGAAVVSRALPPPPATA